MLSFLANIKRTLECRLLKDMEESIETRLSALEKSRDLRDMKTWSNGESVKMDEDGDRAECNALKMRLAETRRLIRERMDGSSCKEGKS